jgi:hypothetical protein
MAMAKAKKALSLALAALFAAGTIFSAAPAVNAAVVAKKAVVVNHYNDALVSMRAINTEVLKNQDLSITANRVEITKHFKAYSASMAKETNATKKAALQRMFNSIWTAYQNKVVKDRAAATAEATVVSVVAPVDVTVNQNDVFVAPKTVKATMSDNSVVDKTVAWDKVVDTKVAGETVLTANVGGKTVTFKVTVKAVILNVVSVSAINKDQVKVTFDADLGTVAASNFVVYEKGNEYATVEVDKVVVEGKTAVITLLTSMEDEEDYTVSVKDVVSKDGRKVSATKDFAYNVKLAVDAATIAFKATTIAESDDLEYIIKDKDGNDITADFAVEDLVVESSDESVVSATLAGVDGDGTRYSVVNVKIDGTDIQTGNTIITVKDSLDKLTKIDRMSLAKDGTPDYAKPTTTLYLGDSSAYTLYGEIENQDGDEFVVDEEDVTFKSNNPAIATVDLQSGVVTPVAEGTATIVMIAESGTTKISKSFTVTVKKEKEATSLSIDKTSVKLVMSANPIDQTVKLTLLDQYGKEFDLDGDFRIKASRTGVVTGLTTTFADVTPEVEDAVATFTLTPYVKDADGAVKASTTVTIEYKSVEQDVTLTKTVTVTSVEAGTFAGYAATVDATKLDVMAEDAEGYDDLNQGDLTEQITVYKKDVNGNYYDVVTEGLTFESSDTDILSVSDAGLVTAEDDGTATVTVKVGTTTINKLTFTVVDSTKKITAVTQGKTTISVTDTADLIDKLYDGDSAAFKAVDQYGESIDIVAANVDAFSSNEDVIAVDNATDSITVNAPAEDTTVTLTVKIAKKIYTITVKVEGTN